MGLLVLPFLKVGGFTVFKMESSDTSEKPFARFAVFVRAFFAIYIGLTAICAILYNVLGMSEFDAVNHAMTTLATGGFSTHDASFGAFSVVAGADLDRHHLHGHRRPALLGADPVCRTRPARRPA